MTRELIRRSCGHLEAVYAVGAGIRRIHEKEREFCRICRSLRKAGVSSDLVVVTAGEDDRNTPEEMDLRGDVRACLSERKQSSDKGDSR